MPHVRHVPASLYEELYERLKLSYGLDAVLYQEGQYGLSLECRQPFARIHVVAIHVSNRLRRKVHISSAALDVFLQVLLLYHLAADIALVLSL